MNESDFKVIVDDYSTKKQELDDRFRHAIYRRLFDFAENDMGFVGVHTLELKFDRLSSDWYSVDLAKAQGSDGAVFYIEDEDKEEELMEAFSEIAYDLAEQHLLMYRTNVTIVRSESSLVATQGNWSESIDL